MAIDNVYFIPLLTKVNVPNKRGKEFKNRNVFFKLTIMAFPFVEFSREGYKIRKVFG